MLLGYVTVALRPGSWQRGRYLGGEAAGGGVREEEKSSPASVT